MWPIHVIKKSLKRFHPNEIPTQVFELPSGALEVFNEAFLYRSATILNPLTVSVTVFLVLMWMQPERVCIAVALHPLHTVAT